MKQRKRGWKKKPGPNQNSTQEVFKFAFPKIEYKHKNSQGVFGREKKNPEERVPRRGVTCSVVELSVEAYCKKMKGIEKRGDFCDIPCIVGICCEEPTRDYSETSSTFVLLLLRGKKWCPHAVIVWSNQRIVSIDSTPETVRDSINKIWESTPQQEKQRGEALDSFLPVMKRNREEGTENPPTEQQPQSVGEQQVMPETGQQAPTDLEENREIFDALQNDLEEPPVKKQELSHLAVEKVPNSEQTFDFESGSLHRFNSMPNILSSDLTYPLDVHVPTATLPYVLSPSITYDGANSPSLFRSFSPLPGL